jgi:transposase-like protein
MLVSASLLGGHMDTLTFVEFPTRRIRRRHATSFKALMVAACCQPGMSLSAVSLVNRLNPNMVRKWVADADGVTAGREVGPAVVTSPVPAYTHAQTQTASFFPVALATPKPLSVIEVQRPGT